MKIASENVGYGWIVSSRTSIGTSARTASVSCPSHSPASGPTATAPTRTRRRRVRCDLDEARLPRALVRREAAARDLVASGHDSVPFHHADRRHLWIGEDRRRDRPIVGARRAARDVGRGDPRLVLAEVREETDARRVADRPDAVAGRQAIVDGHAARRDLHAERLESEPFDARLASGRDEQSSCVDRLTRREVEASSIDYSPRRCLPGSRREPGSRPARTARQAASRRPHRVERGDGRCSRRA